MATAFKQGRTSKVIALSRRNRATLPHFIAYNLGILLLFWSIGFGKLFLRRKLFTLKVFLLTWHCHFLVIFPALLFCCVYSRWVCILMSWNGQARVCCYYSSKKFDPAPRPSTNS